MLKSIYLPLQQYSARLYITINQIYLHFLLWCQMSANTKAPFENHLDPSLSFRGSILWNALDDSVKNEPTLSAFKKRIKNWAGDKCTCKICR